VTLALGPTITLCGLLAAQERLRQAAEIGCLLHPGSSPLGDSQAMHAVKAAARRRP
jgi:hypothetical protein